MAFLKTIWKNNSKHRKLPEELSLQNNKDAEVEQNAILDSENDVITFKLKYLGSTVVEKVAPNENISAEAVKNILKTAKATKGRKKLLRVNLNISLKGIAVIDLQGNDILKISIYKISNCSTDAAHRQIFSFVSTDSTETMECHAFLCSKRKMAETVTLAVAQAFSTAYEAWREMPSAKDFEKKTFLRTEMENMKENAKNEINTEVENSKMNNEEEKLIDFDDDSCEAEDDSFIFEPIPTRSKVATQWVCFDDDFPKESQSKQSFNNFNQVDLILA